MRQTSGRRPRRREAARQAARWAVALTLGACSSDAVRVTQNSFDDPGDVALVCFDTAAEQPVDLSRCADEDDSTLHLHALVTQTGRGEVAAVDLRDEVIIDSDETIPGFTFTPVGELPTAIVVAEENPSMAYVADLGSKDVVSIPTARFRYPASTAASSSRLGLPAAPVDLALAPDQGSLWIAMPDADPGEGQLARVPIDDSGFAGDPEFFVLDPALPEATETSPQPPYCKACAGPGEPACDGLQDPFVGPNGGEPTTFAVTDPVFGGPPDIPRPTSLEIDTDTSTLLVTDGHLPIIHQLDLDDPSRPRPPLWTGTPTDDVVVTPVVPRTLESGGTAEARYIYAIDAVERSVLALDVDLDSGAEGLEGHLLPVGIPRRGRRDRIELNAGARVLEILSPEFPGTNCALQDSDASDAGPDRLRGVFLAVGTADGLLHLVDVHDLDATCRGGDAACQDGSSEDAAAYVYRHRPRIGERITDVIGLNGTLNIEVNGLSFGVGPDGTVEADIAPSLGAVDCPAASVELYPLEEGRDSLLCVLADPWAQQAERWTATFEGVIPGTAGGRGNLRREEGSTVLRGEVPFCRRGVLGAANGPSDTPEGDYGGDLLVLRGELPPSLNDDQRRSCEIQFTDAAGELRLIDFPILRSYPDRLELADTTRGGIPLEEVQQCFPELVNYEVRSGGAYTVVGSQTGFRHRIEGEAEDTPCEPSLGEDEATNWHRAFADTTYDNGLIRFRIEASTDETGTPLGFPTREDTAEVGFTVGGLPDPWLLDVGVLPNAFLFSDIGDRLYTVDIANRGLLDIPLAPFDSREIRAFE